MGFGLTEGLIILAIAVLFFGGKKLPELGKSMGQALNNFKKGLKEGDEEKEDDKKEIEKK